MRSFSLGDYSPRIFHLTGHLFNLSIVGVGCSPTLTEFCLFCFPPEPQLSLVLDVGLSRVLSASRADRLHAAVGREFVLNIFVGTTPLRVCEEHRKGGSILSGQLHCEFVNYTEQGGSIILSTFLFLSFVIFISSKDGGTPLLFFFFISRPTGLKT
jgi:hypothetical protein